MMSKRATYSWGSPGDAAGEHRSFFIDRQEVLVDDIVFLASGGTEPYIGLLEKLWEDGSGRWASVRWLFRPSELPDDLQPQAARNELFLAIGTGSGILDKNILEVIIGKCDCLITMEPPAAQQASERNFFLFRAYNVDLQLLSDAKPILARIISRCNPPSAPKRQLLEEQACKKKPRICLEAKAETGRSRLFRPPDWEELLEDGLKNNKAVLLFNFGEGFTKSQIEEAMMSTFEKITVKAEIVPKHQLLYQQRSTGQAILVFGTEAQAARVLEELQNNVLVLEDDGRPCLAVPLKPVEKRRFPGHIDFDLLRRGVLQAEKFRNAVSTSHCAQLNTIEYEMAVQWRLLHERHAAQWDQLRACQVRGGSHSHP